MIGFDYYILWINGRNLKTELFENRVEIASKIIRGESLYTIYRETEFLLNGVSCFPFVSLNSFCIQFDFEKFIQDSGLTDISEITDVLRLEAQRLNKNAESNKELKPKIESYNRFCYKKYLMKVKRYNSLLLDSKNMSKALNYVEETSKIDFKKLSKNYVILREKYEKNQIEVSELFTDIFEKTIVSNERIDIPFISAKIESIPDALDILEKFGKVNIIQSPSYQKKMKTTKSVTDLIDRDQEIKEWIKPIGIGVLLFILGCLITSVAFMTYINATY